MDHDRPVPAVVGADVLQPEALRELEVELDGRHLPRAPDGVAGLDGDLRAVERAAALVEDELEVLGGRGPAERLGGLVPLLHRADRLRRWPGGQLEVEVRQAVVGEQVQHEVQQRDELALHVLLRGEDVGVVLGHAPHPGEAVHHAGLLVAVDAAELEHPQGQLPVAALARPEDEDVERAVHRLEVVVLAGRAPLVVEVHRREHAVGVPVEVARLLEQRRLGDVGRVDELVAALLVAPARVVLHEPAHETALGVEHGQARADLVGEREQVQLGAELAVVALLGLLEPLEVRLQVGGRRPRRAVDALELGVLLAPLPVGAGDAHELEVPEEVPRRRHVGAAAQVDEARVAGERRRVLGLGRRVLVGAHQAGLGGRHGVRGGVVDDLELVAVPGEDGPGGLGRQLVADEGLRLGDDLAHAGLDALEVVDLERRRHPVGARGQLEVVVEAVLDRRPDAERGAREQVEHGLGQDVGRGVADGVEAPVARRRDDRHLVAVGEGVVQVALGAVDHGDDGVLGQAPADLLGQAGGGGAGVDLTLGTVREPHHELICHRRARVLMPLPGPEP